MGKKTLSAFIMCLLMVGVAQANDALNFTQIRGKTSHLSDKHKFVALTFDDGPSPTTTPKILQILQKHHAVATFFVLGQNAKAHPLLLAKVASAGHEIGNHTYSHKNLAKASRKSLESEVRKTQAVLQKAHLVAHWFRPPYGLGEKKARPVAASANMRTILWSVDARDWMRRDPLAIQNAIMKTVRSGDVILLHDTKKVTTQALDSLLFELEEKGYSFVTLSQWDRRVKGCSSEEDTVQEAEVSDLDAPLTVAQKPSVRCLG